MKYNELVELLLSEGVYDRIKGREAEIFALIPELKVCKGFDQKNSWHVYDVYEHILHVVAGVEPNRPLRLAALFHDIGKPAAFTEDGEGVGHFFGHWDRSGEIFQAYAQRFDLPERELALIRNLIFYHDMNVDKMTDGEIVEMLDNFGREEIGSLFAIKRADLLAQARQYHGLLENIGKQEQRVLQLAKRTDS